MTNARPPLFLSYVDKSVLTALAAQFTDTQLGKEPEDVNVEVVGGTDSILIDCHPLPSLERIVEQASLRVNGTPILAASMTTVMKGTAVYDVEITVTWHRSLAKEVTSMSSNMNILLALLASQMGLKVRVLPIGCMVTVHMSQPQVAERRPVTAVPPFAAAEAATEYTEVVRPAA